MRNNALGDIIGRLPIAPLLEELEAALDRRRNVVMVAPPGAGKTTAVPLALLRAPWLCGKRMLLLAPRRLAARAAACRMWDYGTYIVLISKAMTRSLLIKVLHRMGNSEVNLKSGS